MWSSPSITFALLGALAVVVFGPSCTLVKNGPSSDVSMALVWMVFANLFPLAWAEAEVGKFHRRVSVIMLPRGNDRLRGLPAAIGW